MSMLQWIGLGVLTLFGAAAVQMETFAFSELGKAANKPATLLIALSVIFGTFLTVEAYEVLAREPMMPAR